MIEHYNSIPDRSNILVWLYYSESPHLGSTCLTMLILTPFLMMGVMRDISEMLLDILYLASTLQHLIVQTEALVRCFHILSLAHSFSSLEV